MSSAGRRGALLLAVLLASLVAGTYASRCPGGVLSDKFDCSANSYGCSEVCVSDRFPGSGGNVAECTIACEYHLAANSPSLSACYGQCSTIVCKPSLCAGSCAVDPVCLSHCERGCVLAEELMRCCDTDFPVTCSGHCNEEADGGLCLRNSPRGHHVCMCFDGFALPTCEAGDEGSTGEPVVRQVTDGSFLTVPGAVMSAHSSGRFLVTGVPGRLDGAYVMGGAYISVCEPDSPSQPCSSPKLLPMPANLTSMTYFGSSVSVEASGFVVVGTETTAVAGTGAYVYFCSATGDCSPPRALSVQREYATGSFGKAVTVARYGNGDAIVAVGAPMDDSGHGVVYLWRCVPASSPTSSAPSCNESGELSAPRYLQYSHLTNPMRFGFSLASTMNLLDSPGGYGLVVGAPLAAMYYMQDGAAFYYRINQNSNEPNLAATLVVPSLHGYAEMKVGSVVAISSSGQTIAMSTAHGAIKTMVVNCRTDALEPEQATCSDGTVIDSSYYQLATDTEQWSIALSDRNTLMLGGPALLGSGMSNDVAVFDCKVHEGTDPRAPNCTGPVLMRNGTQSFGVAVAASSGQAFIANSLSDGTSKLYRFRLCPEGRFGPNCASECDAGGCAGRCTDNFSGSGDGGCSACAPGYTGAPSCNLCAPGFVNRYGSCICDVNRFGVNCTGVCPACQNDNCEDGISGSGQCSGNCKNGFARGTDGKCSECAAQRYGPNCDKQCQFCFGGVCHDGIGGDGKCLCQPNYMRSREDGPCDICAPGYYGPSCNPCTVQCSVGSKCNDTRAGDGQCTCPTGYGRDDFGACTVCAPGYYRNGTSSACFKCVDCGTGGLCDPITGACACTVGWQPNPLDGYKCTSCSTGYYGSDCKQCESCANYGTCKSGSDGDGSCHCSDIKYDPATRCSTCREGWVGSGSNCDPCHWTCKACSGTLSSQCTACYGDLVLVGTQCLSSCPVDQLKQGNLCVSTCSTGFFKVGSMCTACPAGCASCGSADSCETCASGYFKYNGLCVQQCPSGMYGSGAVCEKCHESCFSCSGGSESSCTICPPGKKYTSGRCADPGDAASSTSGFLLALIVGLAIALRATRF